jgi:hypothetical protein
MARVEENRTKGEGQMEKNRRAGMQGHVMRSKCAVVLFSVGRRVLPARSILAD